MLALVTLFLTLLATPTLAAQKNEDVILHSMQESLQANGLSPRTASKLAQENVFIGMVMLRTADKNVLQPTAQKVGASLGQVIASTYLSYGEKAIPRAVSAMMNATRSGMAPEMLAKTYRAMAKKDYPLDKTVALIHGISEVAMSVSFRDGGVALGSALAASIEKDKPYVELQKQVLYASKLQDTLTKRTQLAKAQQEKKKADYARKRSQGGGGGGGGASSNPSGGSLSSGNASAASASNSGPGAGSSQNGGTSAGGGSSAGSGNSGGSSGGDASGGNSGGSSGGDASGGNSGGSSGGDASGGNSGGSSGGDSSGNNAGAE